MLRKPDNNSGKQTTPSLFLSVIFLTGKHDNWSSFWKSNTQTKNSGNRSVLQRPIFSWSYCNYCHCTVLLRELLSCTSWFIPQLLFTALTLPLVLPGGSETAWRGSWHIPPQSLSWNTEMWSSSCLAEGRTVPALVKWTRRLWIRYFSDKKLDSGELQIIKSKWFLSLNS